ncbi:MAG: hypothetical protein II778_07630 [Anaerovibrio sp.]|nr:hypothetical protein [Anaerovibrio sp.]
MMNSIKDLFRRNLPAKILALIGAIVLWGFVMNEENPAVNSTFTVPVYTINEPEGYRIDMSIREITLRVKAPRSSFTSVNADDFKAYVDLAEAVEGKNSIKVRTVVPKGFEVIEISDANIDVTMEAVLEKILPVDIQVTGNTGAGSALEKIVPSKDKVKISGPRNSVSKVVRLVGYMPLANNTKDFTSKIKLTPVDDEGNLINSVEVSPPEIEVTAKIMNGVEKKLISVKPQYTGNPAAGFAVAGVVVLPERLEVIGRTEQLGGINEILTESFAIDGIREDETKDVNLLLPDGIIVPNKRVSVKIKLKKSEDK